MDTDLLDLPAIDETLIDAPAASPVPTTEVATAAAQAIDPAKIDLQVIALAHFGDWRGTVKTATDKFTGLVLVLSTQAKIDDAKKLRWRLVGIPRADARKVAKELKSKLSKVSKAIGAEEEAIVEALDAAEAIINQQIEPAEAKLQAEREEKARIERERVAAEAQKNASERASEPERQSSAVGGGRGDDFTGVLNTMELDPAEWQEYLSRALVRRAEVVDVMRQIHADTLAAEMRAAELERQRVENERIAAEQAERQRLLDEQAAELRRQEQEIEAARQRVEAAGRSADLGTGDTPAPGQRETPPNADERAPEPAIYSGGPFSTVESVRFVGDGDESFGVIAVDIAEPGADSTCTVNMPALETSGGEAVHIRTEDLPALPGPDYDALEVEPVDGPAAGHDVITLCWELVKVLRTPYAGRFPSHPKPSPEWWADVRARHDVIEPRLAAVQGDL